MSFASSDFGTTRDGRPVALHVLKAGAFQASFSDYGARWLSFLVPRPDGGSDDLLLGFSGLEGYEASNSYFGATVGRYANRIAAARFDLDGRSHRLAANNGPNHLHGGLVGFDRKLWKASPFDKGDASGIRFELESDDGEEGYPGALHVAATYVLSPHGSIDISFEARCEAPTIVGLTQHAYFNLSGGGRGDILGHELAIRASRYLPVDASLIPTGILAPVRDSPFDFRNFKPIGRDIAEVGGYDHCFVVDREGLAPDAFVECAVLRHPDNGRELRVMTSFPGVQLYTGNYLGGISGKDGRVYERYSALCLETEFFPDSPNHPAFPSTILRPGLTRTERTRYTFSP